MLQLGKILFLKIVSRRLRAYRPAGKYVGARLFNRGSHLQELFFALYRRRPRDKGKVASAYRRSSNSNDCVIRLKFAVAALERLCDPASSLHYVEALDHVGVEA